MNAVEVKRDDEQSQPGAPDSAAQGPIAADQDTDSASASLSDTGRVNSEKETLEIRKLALEIKALAFKQSRHGRFIELLQGVVPVLAILSLVWTVFMGLNQQEEQRKDAESARFERAYTKLGSRLPSERATGVAQASSLLHLAGGARDKDILTALANQLALDEDAAVRSAILNVLSNLDKATSQDALDAALKSIVDLHRVMVQSSGITPFELATALQDHRGTYVVPRDTDARGGDVAIDPNALHETFMRLASLKAALLSVLKAGGRTQMMDHVYCPECDFEQLGIDLSGVSFEGAILPRSQWSRQRLNRASFRNALIAQANFTGAQLEGANFSTDEFNTTRQEFVEATALRHINPASRPELYLYQSSTGAPTFVCADLRNANFQNFPLVTRLDDESANVVPKKMPTTTPQATTVTVIGQREAWPLVFQGANIAGADFQEVEEIVLRPIDPKRTDPYVALHTVRTPAGYRYHYYAQSVPLTYLKFNPPGTSARLDRERERSIEALALSFVETEHFDQAKLPPGVLDAIREESAKRQFRFQGCAAYLNTVRGLDVPPSTARP